MSENDLARIIVDLCLKIHRTLGPGLLESVYEEVLGYELARAGLNFRRQPDIPVNYEGVIMKVGFRADIIVEEKVSLELKSVDHVLPVYFKVLLTYLRVTNLKLGLLINFKEPLIKSGIKRIVNNLAEYERT